MQLLAHRDGFSPAKSPTVIMACTDSQDEIGWLQALDDQAPNVDVVDDYEAERKEILAIQVRRRWRTCTHTHTHTTDPHARARGQGPNFHFTLGDYVAKTLLGAVDDLYDGLDEAKLSKVASCGPRARSRDRRSNQMIPLLAVLVIASFVLAVSGVRRRCVRACARTRAQARLNEYMGVAAGNGASMRNLHQLPAQQQAKDNQAQCCAVM